MAGLADTTRLAGLPGVSLAGDIASIQPIGFSADGKVFAFQEFGLKEGSNIPYSNTYFIDTDKGQYLEGTPFRTELTDKDALDLACLLLDHELAADLLERAELLASELVTNALLHARTDVRLRLALRGDRLHLGVHDGGSRLLRLVGGDPDAEAGRGLLLVERLARAWGVYRPPEGGKVVWCVLALEVR